MPGKLHKIRKKFRIVTSLIILALSIPTISVSAESGRFLDNGNGTVTDSKTGLMWAARDNGEDIDYEDARLYCKSFSAGGFSDWRLPDIEELKDLFDTGASKTGGLGITEKNWSHLLLPMVVLRQHWSIKYARFS